MHAEVQVIVERGHPSCGAAWQAGAERATGDYLHLTADDIEPLEGWDAAAMRANRLGRVPAARVWRPRGDLESGVAWQQDGADGDPAALAQIPFCSMEQWRSGIGPMVPIQYYSDNWFQHKAEGIGLDCKLTDGYEFIHHRPANLRAGESEQMVHDERLYRRYLREGYTWEEARR